ncbi:MAG: hypothetical protein ACREBG_28300 [Pyrinomonadaceae bacterium]
MAFTIVVAPTLAILGKSTFPVSPHVSAGDYLLTRSLRNCMGEDKREKGNQTQRGYT